MPRTVIATTDSCPNCHGYRGFFHMGIYLVCRECRQPIFVAARRTAWIYTWEELLQKKHVSQEVVEWILKAQSSELAFPLMQVGAYVKTEKVYYENDILEAYLDGHVPITEQERAAFENLLRDGRVEEAQNFLWAKVRGVPIVKEVAVRER
jgi:hypothetical protein